MILFLIELEYRNGWLIRTTTKSFAVYAATSTEKQEWMAHINKCIEDLLRKSKQTIIILFYFFLSSFHIKKKFISMVIFNQISNVILISFKTNKHCVVVGGKKPVEQHAAVWVPDNEANVCMHCKQTQFSMLVRRVSL